MPLTFGTKFYLVDLYQDCSHHSLGFKNGCARGVTCFTYSYGEKIKKSFCVKLKGTCL